MKKEIQNNIIVYQAASGAVEVRFDAQKETILLTQQQVAELFHVQKAAISKHIKNIFDTNELDKKATVSILETVQIEGKRTIKRQVEYYNLDLVLSIGYRVNSANATKFRQWATKTLRDHIVKGYTLNKKRIAKNYDSFLQALETIKKLSPAESRFQTADALELVKLFAGTWLSLDAYDKSDLPKSGASKSKVKITGAELTEALAVLNYA